MSSSGDEAPEDITFENSRKSTLKRTANLHQEIHRSELQLKQKIAKREELYKKQKEKKRLEISILEEANKEFERNVIENETNTKTLLISNDRLVFTSDEEDNDSGINLQIRTVDAKEEQELYQDAMSFKKKMLYGKRINRITAGELKILKTKQTKKRRRTKKIKNSSH